MHKSASTCFRAALAFAVLLPAMTWASQTAEKRIIDGTEVPIDQYPTVAVINAETSTGPFGCTGTLIAPTAVLTAAHCVTNDLGFLDFNLATSTVGIGGVAYTVSEIHVHPLYPGWVAGQEGVFDVAVLILNTAVPDIAPTPMYESMPTVGTEVTFAGFGLTGTGETGQIAGTGPAAGNVAVGTNVISEVTPMFISWDFEELDPRESNTAQGDSGGPSFIDVNGVPHVAAVTSWGDIDTAVWGDKSYNVRVDVVAPWIRSIAAGAILVPSAVTIATTDQAVFSVGETNLFDQFLGPMTVVAWTVSGGGTISGSGVFTPTGAGGPYTVTAELLDGTLLTGEVTVVDNTAPTITSAPETSTPTSVAGAPVQFTVGATDGEGDMLTYTWDFGDGNTALGASPTHIYAQAGTYTATVTVSDGIQSISSQVTVTVTEPAGQVIVKRLMARVKFNRASRDSLKMVGGFQPGLGAGFNPAGATVMLDVGGLVQNFTLDGNGVGTNALGVIKFNARKGFEVFTVKLKRGDFSTSWQDEGMLNQTLRKTPVTMIVVLTINGNTYVGQYGLLYTARAGKAGAGR